MEESSRQNILEILEKALVAIKNKNVRVLKELSNQTLHSASIFQDVDNIGVAVLMYSLSKLLERSNYHESKGWNKCFNSMVQRIRNAEMALKRYKFEVFRMELKGILKEVSHLEPMLKNNIQNVFNLAKINKASRLYEHGISVGRTANLLGVSKWELMEYSGKTGINEKVIGISVKERIKYAKSLFK